MLNFLFNAFSSLFFAPSPLLLTQDENNRRRRLNIINNIVANQNVNAIDEMNHVNAVEEDLILNEDELKYLPTGRGNILFLVLIMVIIGSL